MEYDIFNKNKLEATRNHQKYRKKFIQSGGVLPEKIKISYDDKEYVFMHEQDENLHIYMLYGGNKKNRCVTIIVDPDEKKAIIENLSGDFRDCDKGTNLLQIAIKFIKENKKKFNVNRITLTDRATKACCGGSIIFADMYTLLYGQTWYMKNGFFPYDSLFDKLNKKNLAIAKKK